MATAEREFHPAKMVVEIRVGNPGQPLAGVAFIEIPGDVMPSLVATILAQMHEATTSTTSTGRRGMDRI